MINLKNLRYDVVSITKDGDQLNLTDICSGLGWSEFERELSAKITFKVVNAAYKDGHISDVLQPFSPVIIYADIGEGAKECIRGNVTRWELTESSGEVYLNIEAADEVQSLRKNMDSFYFTADHSSSAIITEILNKWNVNYTLNINDVKHAKKVYQARYLCDMIADVLKDIKEKDGGVFFMRAREGVIEILPRGTNDTIYHFDIAENLSNVRDSFDVTDIVTRVKVVAKQRTEGHQKVEATIDGRTEYGVRQLILERGDKETLGEAEKTARKILEERGKAQRKTSIEAPDIPFLRKGDQIRVRSSSGEDYFYIKSIRHDAPQMKMTLELDEVNHDHDTNASDESNSSQPM